MSEYLFPISKTEKRFDQSIWRIFPLESGAVVITSSGQELLKQQPNLLSMLDDYRNDIRNQGREVQTQRRYFRHGGNSDIYTLGDTPIVVKEASTAQSAWSSLDRMDYLYTICKTTLPSHIRVPEHYGAVFSVDLRHQYLFMRKANEGITIEDIKDNPVYTKPIKKLIKKEFEQSKELLDTAIDKFNKSTGTQRDLLPDWHEGNVIVDFSTPTKELPFTLWIIDQ